MTPRAGRLYADHYHDAPEAVSLRCQSRAEHAGLIERQPDPADRRARRVVITEAGRTVHRTLESRMGQVADDVLSGLSPAERQVFRSALVRAAVRLAEIDPPPGTCAVVAEIAAGTAPPAPHVR